MQDIKRNSRHRVVSKKSQTRLILGVVFIIGIMLLFWYNLKEYKQEEREKILESKEYLPAAVQGDVYHKPYFSLSYVEKYEIPEWVAYRMTVHMLNRKKYPRDQDFNPDPAIAEGSGHYHDYKRSGYRRGHLVPSADMAWNKQAMDATFLLSNVAPMREEFNDGIWLELEHNIRDWARKFEDVMVITGPVFSDPVDSIGNNKILVPRYYYKAVFTVKDKEPKVAGFLFDQTSSSADRLDQFVVTIDSIEKITGLDLFSNLYGSWDDEIRFEKQIEGIGTDWTFNEKWYLERVDK